MPLASAEALRRSQQIAIRVLYEEWPDTDLHLSGLVPLLLGGHEQRPACGRQAIEDRLRGRQFNLN